MTAAEFDDAEVVNEYGKFTMIPNEIVLTDELSPIAKVLYMHFVQMANEGITVRSRKFLGERLGRGISAVDRAIRELIDFNALRVNKRFKDDGSPDWSEYRLIIIRRPRQATQGVAPKTNPGGSPENEATPSSENETRGGPENEAIEEDLAESKNKIDTRAHDDHRMFDVFWSSYPLQSQKDAALEAWRRVRYRNPGCTERILIAAQAYAVACATVMASDPDAIEYVPLPAKWLDSGQWQDATPRPPRARRQPPPTAKPGRVTPAQRAAQALQNLQARQPEITS